MKVKVSHIPSHFSPEQFDISVIEIGPQGTILSKKYKGIPILWDMVYKNSKQETYQTVLTITKALTKTTNCAKKWTGTTKKIPALCAGSVLPTFAPDRYPHFQIRSGATAWESCYIFAKILQ